MRVLAQFKHPPVVVANLLQSWVPKSMAAVNGKANHPLLQVLVKKNKK